MPEFPASDGQLLVGAKEMSGHRLGVGQDVAFQERSRDNALAVQQPGLASQLLTDQCGA